MRSIIVILLSSFIISCSEDKTSSIENTPATKDTARWIDDFKQFRDAIYQHDIEKAKSYFDFPITDTTGASMWYILPYKEDSRTDPNQPFTESDFEKHFDMLFSKPLIQTILKVKSEILYANGTIEPIELRVSPQQVYTLYCNYVDSTKTLTISLNDEALINNEEQEGEGWESSTIYIFNVLPNGKIKFHKLLMAG